MCEMGYTLILMAIFEFLGRVSDFRYLKPTILAFFDSSRLAKMVILGYFAIRAKVVVSRD